MVTCSSGPLRTGDDPQIVRARTTLARPKRQGVPVFQVDIPRCNVILGETGTGKSRLVKRLTQHSERLIVADTMLEHEDIATTVDPRSLYKAVRGSAPYRLGIYPKERETLDWVAALAASKRGTTFVLDEYSFWYPTPLSIPAPGMMAMVRCGRKLQQNLFIISQSPVAVYKHLVSQAGLWVFPCDELNDVDYVLKRTRGAIDPRNIPPIQGTTAYLQSWTDRTLRSYCLDLSTLVLTASPDVG